MDIKFLKNIIIIFIIILSVYLIFFNKKSEITDEEIYKSSLNKIKILNKINFILLSNKELILNIALENKGSVSKTKNTIEFSLDWLLLRAKNRIKNNDLNYIKNLDDYYMFMKIIVNLNYDYISFIIKHSIIKDNVKNHYIVMKNKDIKLKPFSGPLINRIQKTINNNTVYIVEAYKHIGIF